MTGRLLTIAALGLLLLAGVVAIGGGFNLSVGALPIKLHDPLRLVLGAALLVAIRVRLSSGIVHFSDDLSALAAVWSPWRAVGAIALLAMWLGATSNAGIAGGADSYGYISQASLWRAGQLAQEQTWIADAPWPDAVWTASPLGYRPALAGTAIVPTYPPGTPLLMAASRSMLGACGARLLIPLAGGALVLLIFALGRRVASDGVAIVAAWLFATSPVFLYMLANPMSDVPAAAAWAAAVLGAMGRSFRAVIAGGFAAAVAIAVRPNLAHLALWIVLWLLFADRQHPRAIRVRRALIFGALSAAGVTLIALVNQKLYGSPWRSGYGDLSYLFALSNGPKSFVRFLTWIVQTQTVLALVGALWFVAATIRRRPEAAAARPPRGLLVAIFAATLISYIFYRPFEEWSYLRFLLPGLPLVAIGTAELFPITPGRIRPWASALVVVALGINGLSQARLNGAFDLWRAESRYVETGQLIKRFTSANAVVLSMQHSGSIRFYGERPSLRYDMLQTQWLDRAVDWLNGHGSHVYLALEDWERPRFEERFSNEARGRLDRWQQVATLDGTGHVSLYDSQPDHAGSSLTVASQPNAPGFSCFWRCTDCAANQR